MSTLTSFKFHRKQHKISHADQTSLSAVVNNSDSVQIPNPGMLAGKSHSPWLQLACLPTRQAIVCSGTRGGRHHIPALSLQCVQPSGPLSPVYHHCYFFVNLEISLFKWSATKVKCSRGIRQNPVVWSVFSPSI